MARIFEWLLHETSLYALLTHATRDTYLILASRFLRMFAYGGVALVLAIFLRIAGLSWTQVGSFMTIALLGDAAISYFFTLKADKIGRRRVLTIGSSLMIFSGTVFAFTKNYWLLLFAAVIGVITPGAHEVGPFRAVQESTLAHLTKPEARTDIYAWFAVSSTLGMATGLFVAGWLTYFQREWLGYEWTDTYPAIFGMYAIVGLVKTGLTLLLSERCEADYRPGRVRANLEEQENSSRPLLNASNRGRLSYTKSSEVRERVRRIGSSVTTKLSPESKRTLLRLGALFAINSFASGMLPVTLMSFYVNWRTRRYFISHVGYAMSVVWLAASVGVLFSAAVARRLGLVKTMVLMHLPNAIFLAFIPLAPTFWIMISLLFASAACGSMDQAPRMAFVAAVFQPEERTAVMGTINLIRTVASAGGPLLSGFLWERKLWWVTFVLSASLKVLYDVGLLVMFVNTKLPEQEGRLGEITVADMDVGILLSENLAHPEEFGPLDDEEEYGEVEEVNARGGDGKGMYEDVA